MRMRTIEECEPHPQGVSATKMAARPRRPRQARGLQRYRLAGVQDVGTELGRGSYAAVVELQFRGLKCAGKRLHRALYGNATPAEQQGMLQRFESECEILGEMKHPNIVQFLGVHLEAGSELPVLVMEFLHSTLSACLDRYGTLPQEISYTILDDVATALCYLHGQDPPVIHRDLTANNVLLSCDMKAKIADLGVAKILNLTPAQMTHMTACPGTPAYMPPEAMGRNPRYDETIDSFSYGVLMLHVSCGQWPLPGEANRVNPANLTQLIPQTEVERREEYFQQIGQDHPLRQLITQCLNNHPAFRPDAEVILRQVREVVSQHPLPFEDKIAMMNEHTAERERLRDEVQRHSSQHQEELMRMNAQLLEAEHAQTQISERLGSLLRAKNEELQAAATTLEAKNQQIAVKDQEIAALEQGHRAKDQEIAALEQGNRAKDQVSSAQDATIEARGATIQRLLRQCDYFSTSNQSPNLFHPNAQLEWRRGANLPVAVTAPQCTVIGGVLYVGGGQTNDDDFNHRVYKYNRVSDEWNCLPRCPVEYFGIGQLDGNLVIVGGVYPNRTVAMEVFQFEEESQQWNSSIPPMPTPRYRPCVVSCELGIAVCGGMGPRQTVATVEVFKTETRQWCSAQPLPVPCGAMRAAVIGDTCYLLGGYSSRLSSRAAISQCFYTKLVQPSSAAEWQSLPNTPQKEAAPASFGGVLLAIGGRNPTIHAYSPNTGSWIHIGDVPASYHASTATAVGNELFVMGGWDESDDDNPRRKTVFIGNLQPLE